MEDVINTWYGTIPAVAPVGVVTEEMIVRVLVAEGYKKNGAGYWVHHDGYSYIYPQVVRLRLDAGCPTLEDLPRFLADDKGGEEAFGYDWHSGIKPALSRLLQGG